MLAKSSAIDRFLRENKRLAERRFWLPEIGKRHDWELFNPTVEKIVSAIDYYGYEIRDENITVIKDIDLGGWSPIDYKPFKPAVDSMINSLKHDNFSRYPYTEWDDRIRKVLLDYVEQEWFINVEPYAYDDIDSRGLCVHNLTFMPSTSIIFNIIVNIIAKTWDVIIVPGPNYWLFTIRAERAWAEVDIFPLEKEDGFLPNPDKLAKRIDEINNSLQMVYQRRKWYVPRVVAYLNANPNNPLGVEMWENDVERLTAIWNVCKDRGVFVIDDLVYRDITFEEKYKAKPMASIPGMFRNTISLFGLSKSYGLASLRAWFVVADELIIREVCNRIFQEMDSSPDLIGKALVGAYNATSYRNDYYKKYFSGLRKEYKMRYYLTLTLIKWITYIPKKYQNNIKKIILKYSTEKMLNGIPLLDIPKNLEVKSGFFQIVDFTKLKGMKYHGRTINTEYDLLKFFYRTSRIRFLVGKSVSWPYEDELIGRITFALDYKDIVNSFELIAKDIEKLKPMDDYIIRKNILADQEQMAHIKVDWRKNAYDKIVSSRYLNSLDYKKQTKRYINSFEEYKDLVLVAVKGSEVLWYSCFNYYHEKFDSELVSLYIKPDKLHQWIGSSLLVETWKELYSHWKKNMIIYCIKDNIPAINFYTKMWWKILEEKIVKIWKDKYTEVGFYFDLKSLIS